MAVKAPADKRFRRAQVSPSRARRFWPPDWRVVARFAVVAFLVVYGGYRSVVWARATNALVVDRVTVTGNRNLSRGEVVALLEGIRGESMLGLDIEAWRERLLNSPWVADAAIRRQLPGTVSVAVRERQPIGIARLADELYLVDRDGTIIDAHGPNYADLDLPVITGLDAHRAGGDRAIDPDRAALALAVVDALSVRKDIAARVSELDVSDVHDAAVLMKDDPTIVRLGEEQFVRRLNQYLELAPTLRERVPDLDYVDVRFDERVYVRPRSAPPLARVTKMRPVSAAIPSAPVSAPVSAPLSAPVSTPSRGAARAPGARASTAASTASASAAPASAASTSTQAGTGTGRKPGKNSTRVKKSRSARRGRAAKARAARRGQARRTAAAQATQQ